MAYGEFYVEHQGWAHWPKVLIMCRKRGYEIVERKRYIPERTCHIEMYPMGLHEEDGEAPICSACRVAMNVPEDERP